MIKQKQKSLQAFIDWADRLDQFLAEDDTLTIYRQAAAEFQMPIVPNVMRVVAIGEVNAGKSSLINALYGENILPVDTAPSTMSSIELSPHNGIVFVDTPGTNAQAGQFDQLARDYLFKADVVLIVLPAKNPFGQSIWSTLAQLHASGNKRFLFVLQQCDLLSPADLEATLSYLREYTVRNNIHTPDFFPVSVKNWNAEKNDASGIPTLTQELERIQNSLRDASSILHARMQSADILLQKIRVQVQAREAPIQQSKTYQSEAQRLITSNTQQNKVALVQLEGDFKVVLADLERQVAELSHAEARLQDLKRENRIRELFGIARQRYDSRTQDLLLEFSAQLKDGFQRTGERIAKLFLNSDNQSFQVSRRTTMEQVEIRLNQADTLIRSGVQNASACGDTLDKIASESGLKSRALCEKARRKFLLTAWLPVILLLIFTAVVPASVQIIEASKSQPSSSSSSESDNYEKLIKNVAGITAEKAVSKKLDSSLGIEFYFILGLVIFLVGSAYVAAVKKSTNKWLLMQLRTVGIDAHEALRQAFPTIQSAFCSELQKMLEASETMLVGIISDFLSKNEGMSNAATADAQLKSLSVFQSDLQKLRV